VDDDDALLLWFWGMEGEPGGGVVVGEKMEEVGPAVPRRRVRPSDMVGRRVVGGGRLG